MPASKQEKKKNHATAIVGFKGSGKSSLTRETIAKSPKKVLMVDIKHEAEYSYLPVISESKIKLWKSGNYRVVTTVRGVVRVLQQISGVDKNGDRFWEGVQDALILFEDATPYIKGQIDDNLSALSACHRHHNVDLIFNYHAFSRIPPELYTMLNYLVIKKTNDDSLKHLDKLPDYNLINPAFERVRADKSMYATEIVTLNSTDY